ncbi:MAG: hypothetical protein J6B80_03140 [Clostridia bacterium]|nr:hypothetical protein [Clostridia bacterium]
MGVLMYVSQVIMAPLTNIELVSFLIIITARRFGFKSLISVYIFAFLEIMTYGIAIWNVMYLYVWAILVLIVILFRKIGNVILYTVISGLFGILFGTLCSVPYFMTGGISMGVAWIISGFSFDITHCIGNVVLTAILYIPITKAYNYILNKTLK